MDYVGMFVEPCLGSEGYDAHTRLYLSLFRSAVIDEVPPYFQCEYGDSFRKHVESPIWVIQCLISNAIKEGEGSNDLGLVADACPDVEIRAQLVKHLEDEARHCRLYLRLIDLVFPDAVPRLVMTEIEAQLPALVHQSRELPWIDNWDLLDNLIQINLGEVRTSIHQKLLEPVLCAYCPQENQSKLATALRWLSADELRHIQYTAKRIGQLAADDVAGATQLFELRSRHFTRYTNKELGSQRRGLFANA